MTMECMDRQALAGFVGTTESEHKYHFYSTDTFYRPYMICENRLRNKVRSLILRYSR